jgi:hypothetical protein
MIFLWYLRTIVSTSYDIWRSPRSQLVPWYHCIYELWYLEIPLDPGYPRTSDLSRLSDIIALAGWRTYCVSSRLHSYTYDLYLYRYSIRVSYALPAGRRILFETVTNNLTPIPVVRHTRGASHSWDLLTWSRGTYVSVFVYVGMPRLTR